MRTCVRQPSGAGDLEALLVVAAPDNLDGPVAIARQRLFQLVAAIPAVCKDVPQERIEAADRS